MQKEEKKRQKKMGKSKFSIEVVRENDLDAGFQEVKDTEDDRNNNGYMNTSAVHRREDDEGNERDNFGAIEHHMHDTRAEQEYVRQYGDRDVDIHASASSEGYNYDDSFDEEEQGSDISGLRNENGGGFHQIPPPSPFKDRRFLPSDDQTAGTRKLPSINDANADAIARLSALTSQTENDQVGVSRQRDMKVNELKFNIEPDNPAGSVTSMHTLDDVDTDDALMSEERSLMEIDSAEAILESFDEILESHSTNDDVEHKIVQELSQKLAQHAAIHPNDEETDRFLNCSTPEMLLFKPEKSELANSAPVEMSPRLAANPPPPSQPVRNNFRRSLPSTELIKSGHFRQLPGLYQLEVEENIMETKVPDWYKKQQMQWKVDDNNNYGSRTTTVDTNYNEDKITIENKKGSLGNGSMSREKHPDYHNGEIARHGSYGKSEVISKSKEEKAKRSVKPVRKEKNDSIDKIISEGNKSDRTRSEKNVRNKTSLHKPGLKPVPEMSVPVDSSVEVESPRKPLRHKSAMKAKSFSQERHTNHGERHVREGQQRSKSLRNDGHRSRHISSRRDEEILRQPRRQYQREIRKAKRNKRFSSSHNF